MLGSYFGKGLAIELLAKYRRPQNVKNLRYHSQPRGTSIRLVNGDCMSDAVIHSE